MSSFDPERATKDELIKYLRSRGVDIPKAQNKPVYLELARAEVKKQASAPPAPPSRRGSGSTTTRTTRHQRAADDEPSQPPSRGSASSRGRAGASRSEPEPILSDEWDKLMSSSSGQSSTSRRSSRDGDDDDDDGGGYELPFNPLAANASRVKNRLSLGAEIANPFQQRRLSSGRPSIGVYNADEGDNDGDDKDGSSASSPARPMGLTGSIIGTRADSAWEFSPSEKASGLLNRPAPAPTSTTTTTSHVSTSSSPWSHSRSITPSRGTHENASSSSSSSSSSSGRPPLPLSTPDVKDKAIKAGVSPSVASYLAQIMPNLGLFSSLTSPASKPQGRESVADDEGINSSTDISGERKTPRKRWGTPSVPVIPSSSSRLSRRPSEVEKEEEDEDEENEEEVEEEPPTRGRRGRGRSTIVAVAGNKKGGRGKRTTTPSRTTRERRHTRQAEVEEEEEDEEVNVASDNEEQTGYASSSLPSSSSSSSSSSSQRPHSARRERLSFNSSNTKRPILSPEDDDIYTNTYGGDHDVNGEDQERYDDEDTYPSSSSSSSSSSSYTDSDLPSSSSSSSSSLSSSLSALSSFVINLYQYLLYGFNKVTYSLSRLFSPIFTPFFSPISHSLSKYRRYITLTLSIILALFALLIIIDLSQPGAPRFCDSSSLAPSSTSSSSSSTPSRLLSARAFVSQATKAARAAESLRTLSKIKSVTTNCVQCPPLAVCVEGIAQCPAPFTVSATKTFDPLSTLRVFLHRFVYSWFSAPSTLTINTPTSSLPLSTSSSSSSSSSSYHHHTPSAFSSPLTAASMSCSDEQFITTIASQIHAWAGYAECLRDSLSVVFSYITSFLSNIASSIRSLLPSVLQGPIDIMTTSLSSLIPSSLKPSFGYPPSDSHSPSTPPSSVPTLSSDPSVSYSHLLYIITTAYPALDASLVDSAAQHFKSSITTPSSSSSSTSSSPHPYDIEFLTNPDRFVSLAPSRPLACSLRLWLLSPVNIVLIFLLAFALRYAFSRYRKWSSLKAFSRRVEWVLNEVHQRMNKIDQDIATTADALTQLSRSSASPGAWGFARAQLDMAKYRAFVPLVDLQKELCDELARKEGLSLHSAEVSEVWDEVEYLLSKHYKYLITRRPSDGTRSLVSKVHADTPSTPHALPRPSFGGLGASGGVGGKLYPRLSLGGGGSGGGSSGSHVDGESSSSGNGYPFSTPSHSSASYPRHSESRAGLYDTPRDINSRTSSHAYHPINNNNINNNNIYSTPASHNLHNSNLGSLSSLTDAAKGPPPPYTPSSSSSSSSSSSMTGQRYPSLRSATPHRHGSIGQQLHQAARDDIHPQTPQHPSSSSSSSSIRYGPSGVAIADSPAYF